MIWTSSLLYLLTGLVGVWVAYDRGLAVNRFAVLVVGVLLAAGIAWSGRHSKTRSLTNLSLACCFVAGALGVYFLVAHDWASVVYEDFAPFRFAGLFLRFLLPDVPWLALRNSNRVAGILVILLPLGAAGVMRTRRRRRQTRMAAMVAMAIALGALLMTFSRGGWLGLAVGGGYAVYLYWRFDPTNQSPRKGWGDGVLLGCGTLLLVAFGVSVFSPFVVDWLERMGMGGSVLSRIHLWQDSLLLVQDYWLTGSGLNGTEMIYSSYIFLLHVPFLYHAHNLYLQILLEQGVVGLLAFISIIAITGWRLRNALRYASLLERLAILSIDSPADLPADLSAVKSRASQIPYSSALRQARRPHRRNRLFGAAAMGSVVALSVHGMLDSEVYASSWAALLFVPVGFAFALPDRSPLLSAAAPGVQVPKVELNMVAIVPALLVFALFLLPGIQSALMANLGAVAQTRAELALYTQGGWPIQDAVRRDNLVDLAPAIRRYELALALNPDNGTARRRLGQIALSQGEYERAQQYLEPAYQRAPEHRVTRQLLGEVYAATGRVAQSAMLWKTVPSEQGQLNLRYLWYQRIHAERELEWIRQSMELATH